MDKEKEASTHPPQVRSWALKAALSENIHDGKQAFERTPAVTRKRFQCTQERT